MTDSPSPDPLDAWLARQPQQACAALPPAGRRRPLPASPAQHGMWLSQEVAGSDSTLLTAPHAYRLAGALDPGALAGALSAVVARHESLRTCLVARDGELRQVIRAPEPLILRPEPVAGPDELASRLSAVAGVPFDLGRDPMLRAQLFRLSEREHVLLVVFHHIANDGWSMDVFHHDLSALYDAATGVTPRLPEPLPDLAVQYPDYAVWQHEHAASGGWDDALAYWRAKLAGVPPMLDLPTDRPRRPLRTSAGARVTCTLPAATVRAVAAVAARLGTTAFTVQLTSFQALLSCWSGQPDLVTGVTVANREPAETEPLIGFFTNVLPVRGAYPVEQTFAEALTGTASSLLESYDHQDLPFELLLRELAVPRAAGHNPLVQVTVASHLALTDPLSLTGLRVTHLDTHPADVQEDLTLYLVAAGDTVECRMAFRTDLFDSATITELGRAYRRFLDAACADPDTPLGVLATRAGLPRKAPAGAAAPAGPDPRPSPAGPPATVAEELVAAAAAEVLRAGPITRDTNFFLAGGTSLAAARVANRLSAELGLPVQLRAIFAHSGLAGLAAHLETLIGAAMASEARQYQETP